MDIYYTALQKIVLGLVITALFIVGLVFSIGNRSASGILAQERGFFLIDLNKATADELRLLPFVSDSMAAEIVRYRQEKGHIKDISELLNVKGIGPVKLKRMMKYLKDTN